MLVTPTDVRRPPLEYSDSESARFGLGGVVLSVGEGSTRDALHCGSIDTNGRWT
jgi:hypothetical protein